MTFEEARKKKFEAGSKEHKQPWDVEHIDVDTEIQQECLDLYNYASLKKEKMAYQFIMAISKHIWKRIAIDKET